MQSSTKDPKQQQLASLWLLVAISAFGPVVLNGVLPANTAIMQELQTSYGLVQLVLTVFMVASMIAQVLLGSLSDVLGRKPVMIFSLLVFTVGSIVCAAASSIEVLLIGRFVQGFGAAVCTFLPRTIIRDVYPRDKSASVIGYMTTAMMAGPLLGPAIGGWVTDSSSWRFMYVGLSVVGLLLSVLCFFFQRETLNSQTEGTVRPGLTESCKRLFASRLFMALVLLTCGSVGIYYAFIGGSPYVLMQLYGLSASAYGIWFAVVAIGYLTGNFLAGRYSSQIGVNRMIVVGSIPGVLGFVLFWLLSSWQHPLALFLPMQLIALWNGITLPNLMSAVMSVMPDIAGAASGLAGTLMTGIGIVFTLILSFITAQTVLPLLLVISFSAGMALLGFLMWLSIVREPAYSTQVPGLDDDNELD